MLGYLSEDIICSEKQTVFPERSTRKTVSIEEQIMSKDKYPSIFSQPHWGYCVYYPSVLKIGEYPRIFPSFCWRIFGHVTRLDQSRASENIWWIIILHIMCGCQCDTAITKNDSRKVKWYYITSRIELSNQTDNNLIGPIRLHVIF